MPSLVQLQYALAVEEHRHFGKAARACHVSQPTLSQQLQKLEDEAGVILFDRTKKPILPTGEGSMYLEQARAVLREHEKLAYVSKQTRSGAFSGEFRLAVIPTVASDLLPVFLRPFSAAYPAVTLHIEELKTETILNELAQDRLDGAILATPVEGEGLKVHPLYYEPFLVYLSSGHPLLKEERLGRDQLDASEMWLLQDGHCFKDQVLNYCARGRGTAASSGNVHFRSGSLDTLRRLVRNNRGHTLIPAMMAHSLPAEERRGHVRPFRDPRPTREVSLIYRRDHWKLPILKAIEKTIGEHLPKAIPRRPEKSFKVLDVSPR
ncbi:MAG: LysR family transcriptional regulator [Bdellovibrionales bacterium]|nr:LysR family transcriptional regulator [Bdellovibrionales bacterium]